MTNTIFSPEKGMLLMDANNETIHEALARCPEGEDPIYFARKGFRTDAEWMNSELDELEDDDLDQQMDEFMYQTEQKQTRRRIINLLFGVSAIMTVIGLWGEGTPDRPFLWIPGLIGMFLAAIFMWSSHEANA